MYYKSICNFENSKADSTTSHPNCKNNYASLKVGNGGNDKFVIAALSNKDYNDV